MAELVTTEDIAKQIHAAKKKFNAYMPISAGIESTATLLFAARDPDIVPFCCHWYEDRYGPFADAMAFYSRKQAEHFDMAFGNDKSMLSAIGYTREVPIIISGLSAFMSVCIGAPGGHHIKWFMMGANAEDDMRMRLQFREYRKIMANFMSDCLDSSGVSVEAMMEIPEIRNPLDFLSKAEMISFIMRHDPKLYKLIWTCPYPKDVLKVDGKVTGYVPCGECNKCLELKAAEKTAMDAKFRFQEGIKYFGNLKKNRHHDNNT